MKVIRRCMCEDYPALVAIWERSVRASHDFLDDDSIEEIKDALIPDYFPNVELYALSDNDSLVGFIGLHGNMIALIAFAFDKGATRVDVNEQNPSALAFYRAKGFKIIGRDATDDAGRPFPILHLATAPMP